MADIGSHSARAGDEPPGRRVSG
ncbi:N utilization substance protein B, partial [Mycobacteroides abscessus subsp. abscessus]|nr:N utilization substance protein B [Mycobacteroides abscessus subsp. abscessus]